MPANLTRRSACNSRTADDVSTQFPLHTAPPPDAIPIVVRRCQRDVVSLSSQFLVPVRTSSSSLCRPIGTTRCCAILHSKRNYQRVHQSSKPADLKQACVRRAGLRTSFIDDSAASTHRALVLWHARLPTRDAMSFIDSTALMIGAHLRVAPCCVVVDGVPVVLLYCTGSCCTLREQ